MVINKNDIYETINGNKVKIFMVNRRQKSYNVIGAFKNNDDWKPASWTINGRFVEEMNSAFDLVYIRTPKNRKIHKKRRGSF